MLLKGGFPMLARNTIAAKLKEFREAAGMTIYEVGEKIGRSGKTVSAWECGRGQPDADMLLRLCALYDVKSISDFYGEAPPFPALSSEQLRLLSVFDELNEEGREKVFAYINDLSMTGIYKKRDSAVVVSKEA